MRFKAYSQQKARSAFGKKNRADFVGSFVALASAVPWKFSGTTRIRRSSLATMTSYTSVQKWKTHFRSYWMNGRRAIFQTMGIRISARSTPQVKPSNQERAK